MDLCSLKALMTDARFHPLECQCGVVLAAAFYSFGKGTAKYLIFRRRQDVRTLLFLMNLTWRLIEKKDCAGSIIVEISAAIMYNSS